MAEDAKANNTNNKRIAKNTLLLYMRMIFLMLISLYTSRVVLNSLGVIDYGIYNVVGGFVAMFSLLSASLSSAISRFTTFELGKNDFERLQRVFSSSVTILCAISLIIVVLIETFGVWFLNTHMTIPAERTEAANWVLQLSVISFVVGLISVPYNACIIAHEKMSAFAYISILEAAGKLVVAFLINHNPIDRLVFYGILLVAISVIVRVVYGVYCKRNFRECAYRFVFDKKLLGEMFSYTGWNFIGSSSAILRDQGGNVITNMFFGPAVNAARGIANQVNRAVSGFVMNFMMALRPQIIKSYASGNREYMMMLIFQGARLSFYLILLLSLPILVSTHYILVLWLKLVPEHTVAFVRLILLFAMSESVSHPLVTATQATGKIRDYQIVVGGLQMMNLPISYLLLRFGCVPEAVLIVALAISQCCLASRLIMLRRLIRLSARKFLKEVYLNVGIVTIISAIPPFFFSTMMEESLLSFIVLSVIALMSASAVIYFVGCNKRERALAMRQVQKLRKRFIKR